MRMSTTWLSMRLHVTKVCFPLNDTHGQNDAQFDMLSLCMKDKIVGKFKSILIITVKSREAREDSIGNVMVRRAKKSSEGRRKKIEFRE